MARSKRRGRRIAKPLFIEGITFNRGLRDSLDATLVEQGKAFQLQNCMPATFGRAGGAIGRPGFTLSAGTAGSVIQLIHQFSRLNTDEQTLVVGSGEIYEYNWGADTTTKMVSTANLTTNSIVLHSSRRVFAVTFTDKVLFSDGVNTPFLWDGTSGSGGITKLTNCPVLFGQPTVYYAKVFGIKNAERSTIVWSEEADATIGYEATVGSKTYNNAWTLGQTDQEPLHSLRGTNEALYYWRARSTGAIWGAVNDDFQTSGTQEGVSSTVGSTAQAMASNQDKIYFIDADGRPYRLFTGEGKIERLDDDLIETAKSIDPARLVSANAVYHPELDLIMFSVVSTSVADASAYSTAFSSAFGGNPQPPATIFCLDEESGEAACTFAGFSPVQTAIVKNPSDGTNRLMHGDDSGNIYYHGTLLSGPWSDNTGSDVAITHIIETQPLAHSRDTKTFDRVDLHFDAPQNLDSMTVIVTTPDGVGSTQTITQVPTNTNETRYAVGLDNQGRWARVKLTHAQLAEEFGLYGMDVEAFVEGPGVGVA